VHWVSPELVCEVSFQEWTQEGRMRQPIFLGLREDKPAQAVRREQAEALPASAARKPANRKGRRAALPRQVGRKPKGTSVIKGSGGVAEPTLTNLGKVYWPEEGYTKGDLLAYYREIAPIILPYLHDRPESLHRHPNGIDGKSFFQKDVSRQPPPAWVHTVNIGSESGKQEITYLLCQDEPSLLYLANLGCIELNPWNSRVQTLDRPDYLVMDLDPENIPFSRVIETAQVVRKVLERAALASYCKTSGKRGLHVYVPLAARYADEQVRQFAEILARLVHQELPDSTSLVRSPALRQGRVYLDYLQNRRGQTLAAPYSVRPYPGATVSTPLRWSEVKKGLDPTRFTLKTLPARLQKLGDLWGPVLGSGIDLAAGLQSWGRQDG
jgi:bifunctional non-homologous end joining protein LigD